MITTLTPRTMTHVLFKRRPLFLKCFVGSIALMLAYLTIAHPIYESEATLLSKVINQDMATPDVVASEEAKGSAASATMAQQFVNSERLLIRSRDILAATILKLGPDAVYPGISVKAANASMPALDMAVDKLDRDLTVKVNQDTNVLLLQLDNRDPSMAQAALQTIVSAVFDKQATVMRAARTGFVDDQREDLRKKAYDTQQALVDFRRRNNISSLDEEKTLLLKQRDQIQIDLADAGAALKADWQKLASLKSAMGRTPQDIQLTDENDRTRTQVDDARTRLDGAQMRYQEAKQNFAEGNPELLDARQQLELAKKNYEDATAASASRVRTGVNPNYQSLDSTVTATDSDARGLQATINQRQQQLNAIDVRLKELDQAAPELIDLQSRADSALKDFQSYLERTQASKIVDDLNRGGITGSLSVLQSPTLPYRPIRPKALLLIILSIAVGLMLGMGFCLAAEMLDTTISLPEQVEPAIGLPLLITLPLSGPQARAAMTHGARQ